MTLLTAERAPILNPASDLRFALTLLSACILTWSAVGGPEMAVLLGVTGSVFVLLGGEPEEHFPMLLTWGVTSQTMVIQGRSVFLVLAAVAITKLLMVGFQRRTKISVGLLMSGVILVALQLRGELMAGVPLLRAAGITAMLILFVCVVWLYDWGRVDFERSLIAFVGSSLLAIGGATAASGGDLARYIDATDNLTRFGEGVRGLGGAMTIPLFAVSSLCLLLILDIRGERRHQVARHFLSLIFIGAGLLTISRVFVLGVVILAVALLLVSFTKSGKLGIRVLVSEGVLALFAWIAFRSEVYALLERLGRRTFEAGLLSGREEIYAEAFVSLREDPVLSLLGRGAMGYVLTAQQEGSPLGQMAHNLLLDVIFSWGFIGAALFLLLCSAMMRKCASRNGLRIDAVSLLPAVMLVACLMSGGSMWYYSSYVFLFVMTVLGPVAGREASTQGIRSA